MDHQKEIERIIDVSVLEDIASGDITSEICVPSSAAISGKFILKQAGVIAGLPFLKTLYNKIDPNIQTTLFASEGHYYKAGTLLAQVRGPARGILAGERIALNMIQHTSGIATMTHKYVNKLAGLPCAILDTRKTLPGLRALEKYAVKVGGGKNHRFTLDERFIIKTNHLRFFTGRSTSPIKEAIQQAKKSRPHLSVEIEIQDRKQLKEALETSVDVIMLQHMMPKEITKCVKEIRKTNKKVFIQSLNMITIDTVRIFAETGVDGICIGSVTYSVPSLDIIMKIY